MPPVYLAGPSEGWELTPGFQGCYARTQINYKSCTALHLSINQQGDWISTGTIFQMVPISLSKMCTEPQDGSMFRL